MRLGQITVSPGRAGARRRGTALGQASVRGARAERSGRGQGEPARGAAPEAPARAPVDRAPPRRVAGRSRSTPPQHAGFRAGAARAVGNEDRPPELTLRSTLVAADLQPQPLPPQRRSDVSAATTSQSRRGCGRERRLDEGSCSSTRPRTSGAGGAKHLQRKSTGEIRRKDGCEGWGPATRGVCGAPPATTAPETGRTSCNAGRNTTQHAGPTASAKVLLSGSRGCVTEPAQSPLLRELPVGGPGQPPQRWPEHAPGEALALLSALPCLQASAAPLSRHHQRANKPTSGASRHVHRGEAVFCTSHKPHRGQALRGATRHPSLVSGALSAARRQALWVKPSRRKTL